MATHTQNNTPSDTEDFWEIQIIDEGGDPTSGFFEKSFETREEAVKVLKKHFQEKIENPDTQINLYCDSYCESYDETEIQHAELQYKISSNIGEPSHHGVKKCPHYGDIITYKFGEKEYELHFTMDIYWVSKDGKGSGSRVLNPFYNIDDALEEFNDFTQDYEEFDDGVDELFCVNLRANMWDIEEEEYDEENFDNSDPFKEWNIQDVKPDWIMPSDRDENLKNDD